MKVGKKEILLSTTILIPYGEEAYISHKINEGNILKCTIKIIDIEKIEDIPEEERTKVKTKLIDDSFVIEFKNFERENVLGYSTREPKEFAILDDNKKISFLSKLSLLKSFAMVDIQIMMEV